jgi:tetratricopeptide (TPR) repeat protein
MSPKISLAVSLGVILIAGIFCASSANAQGAPATSLADQLKAQYKLTKIVPESNGYKVAEPGTLLVIQKDGIFGVPLASDSVDPVIYAIHKDADLHHSNAGASPWKFGVGHKVYLSKLDVDSKHEKVLFTIVECDSSNPAKPSYYKSVVDFEFPNGYLAAAEAGQIEDVISQVLTIDSGINNPQPPVRVGPSLPGCLTNDDIIKLVQAKLPDSIVLAKIKSSSCDFDTSTDALIKLKGAGASDPVLQAILDAGAQSNPVDAGENSRAATSSKASDTAQSTLLSGQYFMRETGAQLQLNPDGSFSLQAADGRVSPGHFTVNGETLALTYVATGRSSFFRIQGDKFYADTGKAWVRQGDAPAPTAQSNEPSGPPCSNYDSCIKIAEALLESSQWSRSLTKFQEASQLDPSKGDAWAGMGNAYLQMGQYDDAVSMWDKALELGATLSSSVCHAKAACGDTGDFLFSTKEVSFVSKKGEKEFAAAPSAVTSEVGTPPVLFGNGRIAAYYLQLRFSGKNYRFYYGPKSLQCRSNFLCSEPGLTQQKVFADYVHGALVRMATGDFGSQPSKP